MTEPRAPTLLTIPERGRRVRHSDAIRELADKRVRQANEYRRAQQVVEARMLELIASALRDVADVIER